MAITVGPDDADSPIPAYILVMMGHATSSVCGHHHHIRLSLSVAAHVELCTR